MTASEILASAHKSTREDRKYCQNAGMAFNYRATFAMHLRNLYAKLRTRKEQAGKPGLSSYAPTCFEHVYPNHI
jgi:hypothetical protein